MKLDLSVVIATFNERENIGKLIKTIDTICKKNGIKEEILVADDSSPDKTYVVVRKLEKKYPNLKLILRKKREGLGAALLDGYLKSNAPIVMSMDADFSHDPKEIPKMYHKIKKGFDVVQCSRYMKGGEVVGKPFHKIIVSKGAAFVASLILGMRMSDYTNNFRMFERKALPKRFNSKGNVFLAEFLYNAHKKGLKITEIPITFVERKEGKSKTRLLREISLFMLGVIKLRLGIW
jgi:dolichol-phosphate mannosyltransferase